MVALQAAQLAGSDERFTLTGAVVLLAVSLGGAMSDPAWKPWHKKLLVALVVTLAFQFLASLKPAFGPGGLPLEPEAPFGERYLRDLAARLAALSAGWALALVCLSPGTNQSNDESREPSRGHAAVIFLLGLVVLAGLQWLLRMRYAIVVDEQQYLFQASALRDGMAVRPLARRLAPFLTLRNGYYSPAGGVNGQYPVGWPALLAGFGLLRLTWLAPVVMGALGAMGSYLLGTRLAGRSAGLLAATLLLVHPDFARLGATYFADVPALACAVLATALLAKPMARLSASDGLGAGFLLGLLFAIRPLTGMTLGVSILVFAFAFVQAAWPKRRVALAIVAGGIPGVLAVLWYNAATNGSAFRLGYGMAEGSLQQLGFGLRGTTLYAGTGVAHRVIAPFTHLEAIRQSARLLAESAQRFGNLWLALPALCLVLIGVKGKWRWAWLVFAPLPVAHFFFYVASYRYLFPLLPFALAGLAALLVRQRGTGPLPAPALAVVCGAAVVAGLSAWRIGGDLHRQALPRLRAVEAFRDSCGPVLLFVHEPAPDEPELATLWWFNREGFKGPVVVARDLGEQDSVLVNAMPGRPYRVEWSLAAGTYVFQSLPPRVPGGCAQ